MAKLSREYHLLRVYGLTLEQYDELLAKQNGGCGVCGKTTEEEGKNLAVDHNHKTGEVRGLLCSYCNHRLIGRHTDWELVQKMANYLLNGATGWFVPKPKKRRRKPRKAKNVSK